MFAKAQRVHLIGIGGIGMSGIAEILLSLAYPVSGSDLQLSQVTRRLQSLGATIFEGHDPANVAGAAVVVTSTAVAASPVDDRNAEVAEARRRKIPVIQRAEMLAELMRLKYGIAVAGTHGKTTTTSMIASVLTAGGLDPTLVVGGRVDRLDSNARLGQSQYLVAEADESDRSFLKLSPILAVVTNIDREHMDTYRDMADVEDAFVTFMEKVPFYGAVIACCDDPRLAALLPRVQRRIFTYGVSPQADYLVRALPLEPPTAGEAFPVRARFEVEVAASVAGDAGAREHAEILGPFDLFVPGEHNVLNAAAAAAIAHRLDVPAEQIAVGLRQFRGVDRRFQTRGTIAGVAVIDDYGHHPTEIRATLRAARSCSFARVHVLFQPHRYSRTRDLLAELAAAFADADSVEVLDIYPAGEAPLPGVSAPALVAASTHPGIYYADSFAEAAQRLARRVQPGDAVLTLGAGNISQAVPLLLEALEAKAGTALPQEAIAGRE
jgi:UDP-N-acetylmuramate--alanine ligase